MADAEIISIYPQPEVISRRTDDPLFNVYYLANNITDRDRGLFAREVEEDVLEQDETDIAEADIHKLAPIVIQRFDPEQQQFISLGTGTVDNNIKGVNSLDTDDPDSMFEFYRRVEEVTDEVVILDPEVNAAMRSGKKKISWSASPTRREASAEAAESFDYDDRMMLRIQGLSANGQLKNMQSFTLFDIPTETAASFLSDRYGRKIEPTAIAIMQFCNEVILEEGTNEEIIADLLTGVMGYLEEDDRESVERQLEAFLNEQAELKRIAKFYAEGKLDLEKDLALSLNGYARESVLAKIDNLYSRLSPGAKELIDERFDSQGLYVDDIVALLVLKMETLTVDNRAGLATLNERTIERVASKIGLESALEMAASEQYVHQMHVEALAADKNFIAMRNEQLIAESGVGCGGGCAVSVVGLFGEDTSAASAAGLKSTLYKSKELDKNSKCNCGKHGKKARVLSDGHNVICTRCGSFDVNGKRGQLKKAA